MKTYIALLRGINVGGHRKIKMADLKSMLERIDFKDVATYIQSGNVVFKSNETSKQHLEQSIENGIKQTFDFEVVVLVKSLQDIKQILNNSPYTNTAELEANQVYYAILKTEPEPDQDNFKALDSKNYPNDTFCITKNCVYLNYKNGAGKAKLTNNIIEKKLKVSATSRNHRTMLKLIEISEDK